MVSSLSDDLVAGIPSHSFQCGLTWIGTKAFYVTLAGVRHPLRSRNSVSRFGPT